jgi:hypothetical protein
VKIHYLLLVLLCSGFSIAPTIADDGAPNYRAWQHVKTMIIEPAHALSATFGGIHHIYANPEAMTGLSTGDYSDGAVLVFDLRGYESHDNTIVETDRRRLDVMRYNLKLFATTGGWEYSSYLPGQPQQRVVQDVTTACFACHQGAKESGYVFSQYRP